MADNAISMQMNSAMINAKRAPLINKNVSQEKALKVAQDFEAFTLSQFLQPMFANLDAAAPFGGGNSEKIWRQMQVDEYGKAISRAGGIGIADAVYGEILKMQEAN